MCPPPSQDSISRRNALQLCTVTVAGVALQRLLPACLEEGAEGFIEAGTQPGHDAGAQPGPDAGAQSGLDAGAQSGLDASTQPSSDANAQSSPDAGADAGGTTAADTGADAPDASAVPWASGGTRAMTGPYPDPFANGTGTVCTLTKAMILGPCYADTLAREDISEGAAGIPLRLSFRVVHAKDCAPVAGATVDVWHVNVGGNYSEFAAGTTCNPGQESTASQRYCRGVQTTNSEGRVDFSSVVPGWYAGRAVHIHFTVRVNGEEYLTSQLFFDDALLDEIEQQVDYRPRGTRDTRNTQDIILPADEAGPFVLDFAKRSDGALHAWKVLALRSSLDETLPSAGGIGGGFFDFFGNVGFPGTGVVSGG
jgi:protocatechuate 3,4-dioxygenase beta subunit